MNWLRIIALILELISMGLNNAEAIEEICRKFDVDFDEIKKWL